MLINMLNNSKALRRLSDLDECIANPIKKSVVVFRAIKKRNRQSHQP